MAELMSTCTPPRNCLLVTPRLPPAVGGGESFGELLIKALAAYKWRVSVFTSAAVEPELSTVVSESGGNMHLPLRVDDNRSNWEQATFARSEQVHEILMAERTQAVFCLSHDSAITTALAIGENLDPIPAVVGSYVDTSVLRTPLGSTRARLVYSLDAIGSILAESEFYRSVAVRSGFPAGRVIVGSAVDIQRFAGADARRGRDLVGVRDDQRMVLCASRFTPRKRIEDLLYAMAEFVVDSIPDATLVIAGSVQSGSERYRAWIADLIPRLGLSSRCQIAMDLNRQDIADVTAASSLAVQPSEFEGLGRSVLEAMAAGTCVIATETTGFNEIVCNIETGLTYRVGDLEALGTAIRRLLSDDQLARRLRDGAREWVGGNMSIGRLGRSAVEAYDLAEAHRRKRHR